jgi:hypothetical protein
MEKKILYDLLVSRKKLIGIEIGVEDGNNAYDLLNNCDFEKLYLVDPFLEYEDPSARHFSNQSRQTFAKESCLTKLNKFSNFELIEKTSDKAVTQFEDDIFDFIFIDGLHTYEQVKKDLINYYPKLKVGGVFSGHDFNYIPDVNQAVTEFASHLNIEILQADCDVWYWIKK